MATREEIEAAELIVEDHRNKRRLYPADVLLPAMRLLAEWAISERAERQRRIEAAAEEIAYHDISPTNRKQAIINTITRHLDADT